MASENPQELSDVIASIKSLLSGPPPYSSGILPIPLQQFTVFYNTDGSNGKINLANATPEELEHLSDACQPATFGVNNKDVYDESYRKARKMDFGNFATLLDVEAVGLLDVVRNELLEGENEFRQINAEIYKLNVYGKDSFFRSHKDTPRKESMFGSLVIVFPTPHEGGEFVLRQSGNEWIVDFAKIISEAEQQPCVGYVTFFSDVEHEILKVRSGNRVTLTYNLYFAPESRASIPSVSTPSPYEKFLALSLYMLMSDETVMPNGGYLGFGLRHQYPTAVGMHVNVFRDHLKGPDAMLVRALSTLGVTWDIRAFSPDVTYDASYLHKRIVAMTRDGELEELGRRLEEGSPMIMGPDAEAVQLTSISGNPPYYSEISYLRAFAPLTHVEDMACSVHSTFVTYGNDAEVLHLYNALCVVVDLPQPAERIIRKPTIDVVSGMRSRGHLQTAFQPLDHEG